MDVEHLAFNGFQRLLNCSPHHFRNGFCAKVDDQLVPASGGCIESAFHPGHASVAFTLEVYSYVLPHMQDTAAIKVEALLMAPRKMLRINCPLVPDNCTNIPKCSPVLVSDLGDDFDSESLVR